MKLFKLKKSLYGLVILMLPTISCSWGGVVTLNNVTKAATTGEVTPVDYNAFNIRNGNAGSITQIENGFKYKGAWDSNFAVTDQFDTRAGNYSLKAHVSSTDWVISNEMYTGFNVYYNSDNYITFYLKWNNGECSQSITEAVFLNKTNGVTHNDGPNAYQTAILPNGDFTTASNGFTDVWSDGVNWKDTNGNGINLRTSSTILVNKGFDMTLHVNRTTYKERLVDVMQIQIDGYDYAGTNALTVFTPEIAVDAATNPHGNGVIATADKKPQIGFMQSGMDAYTVSYTDIVFTNKNTATEDITITRFSSPTTGIVDEESDTITYKNSESTTNFMLSNITTPASEAVDFEATVSGTQGAIGESHLGFVYYFNETNFAVIYLRWLDVQTIAAANVWILKDDESNNITQIANTNNSDTLTDLNNAYGIYDNWTDYGHWTLDSYDKETINCNLRDVSTISVSSGLTFGFHKSRTTYNDRLVDLIQIRATAKDNNNILRTYYSASIAFDAFTYPKGVTETSEFINSDAKVGFYTYNNDTVTLSNVKHNGVKANLLDGYGAKGFAQEFMDKTESAFSKDEKTSEDFTTVWGELKTIYNSYASNSAKETLKTTTGVDQSSNVIESALYRYDYIVSHYDMENFIDGREVAPVNPDPDTDNPDDSGDDSSSSDSGGTSSSDSGNTSSSDSGNTSVDSNDTDTVNNQDNTMIIVIVSVVGATIVCGAVIAFVIVRKKHKK